ncbi:MAG: phospholipase D family protein [Rhizobium sp.]|nr:phospholipase D family protein [Rhizobium sp.]MBW8320930.1 phospholipase D family protein [Rhizobium sp.]MBW8445778.1 phospholipase D family protein [Arenimonas sp.]
MATKEFILQGFTARTHKDAIRELFEVDDIKSVLVSVAYMSESGIEPLEDLFTKHAPLLTVFAGIRNDVTSYQGLMKIHGIAGSTLYAVDTGSRTVVFHPKLYLVRGAKEVRLVMGSANLTLGGLNNNIEAGMLFKFDLGEAEDLKVVAEIESQLLALPNDYVEHILLMDDPAKIEDLKINGRVTDELSVPPPRPSTSSGGKSGSDPVPRIKLKTTPMHRRLRAARPAKAPVAAVAAPAASAAPVVVPPAAAPATGVVLDLMWESKPLTERDLNIPTGTNTNKTGSINLDKGLLPEAEDHRPYFRAKVFDALNWTYRSPTVDEAWGQFQLVLKGVSHGVFDLVVRHTNSTTSKSYLQNNAMTRVSWGPMRDYVADPSLIGRTLALYRDKADPTQFVIEID